MHILVRINVYIYKTDTKKLSMFIRNAVLDKTLKGIRGVRLDNRKVFS